MTKRPNIVFIMADQLAPQVLSAYGGTRVRTPHLSPSRIASSVSSVEIPRSIIHTRSERP